MRVLKLLAAVLAASMALSPTAAAQQDDVSGTTRESAAELVDGYYRHLYRARFDDALAAADRIDFDETNLEAKAIVHSMRAGALLGLKRVAEARSLIAAIVELKPREPVAFSTLFQAGIITENYDVAADAFDTMLARFPDAARGEMSELVSFFLRNEPEGQDLRNEDRRIALARIGFGGDTSVADWRAFDAISILLKRGDIASAINLLQYVDEVEAIETMLIDNRYSALWPKLEETVGNNLANVRRTSVASAERAFEAAPADHKNLSLLADSYRQAGRLRDAIALRSKLPATTQAMAAIDEDMGWAVNNVALAMHEAGNHDEGDRLFAMLNEAQMPEGRGEWRVSMYINRLEALVYARKYAQAEMLIGVTVDSAAKAGNPYARQLVRRIRYCMLSSLGKNAEAAAFLPEVIKNASDAPGATIEGLLCGGQIDTAERIALETLSDTRSPAAKRKDWEEEFVRSLQPVPLTTTEPSDWAKAWEQLRGRPAIAAAFKRLGRPMPARFLPLSKAASRAAK